MFKFNKNKETKFVSMMEGKLITLDEVDDPVFSERMMGDGYAIEPISGKIVAPCDGVITMIFDTLHAIGITTALQEEIILHIGIDTVNLAGEGFTLHVEENQQVKAGDHLMDVDLEIVKKAGYSTQSCALFQNMAVEVLKANQNVVLAEKDIIKIKHA